MEDKKMSKVNSPEQLNQYIKLSNPSVWILLIAIIILLLGVCMWGIFGKMDTKVKAIVISDSYNTNCYIKEEDIKKVEKGMKLEINSESYEILYIDNTPEKIDDNFNDYAIKIGNLKYGDWVYKCSLNTALLDGIYSGDITVESVKPSTFIIN